MAGVKTLEEANQYLSETYLVWWEREMTVEPASADNAHRPLDQSHSLEASLSHVEMRQIENNYTFRLDGVRYRIKRQAVVSGLRRANVRVEQRLDGSIAVRYQDRYLPFERCEADEAAAPKESKRTPAGQPAQPTKPGYKWNETFNLKGALPLWKAALSPGHRKGPSD